MQDKSIDYIFEASWEVCNKIGGIYTVLSTKAKCLQALHKEHVIFIGPDVWDRQHQCPVFLESQSVLRRWRESCTLPEGMEVRVGRWDVPGRPIAILVKFDCMYADKDAAYGRMWERFGVDSLHAYGDYDEGCAFGRAAAEVMMSLAEYFSDKASNFVAHFDEWTTGMGLLTIKDRMPQIATVFTTHATSIGRSICGNGKPLYDYMQGYNGNQMARELNMEAKHSLERAAAHAADCFTTVSDVTARECTQLLERTPDIVTPNGFENKFVPVNAKFKKARAAARARILTVANTLTGRNFDDSTFIMCTSGRCEFRNKGIDLFCDVLSRLSEQGTARRVLALVAVPAWSAGPRADLQQALADGFNTRLADPMLTHNLHNYNEDVINTRLHQLGFADANTPAGVTVIYVPCYLNGNDGIFDMSYYDLLIGMDATVFPSYYEPWGYTPLESVAFGVPTITTSLSGFGQWVKSSYENSFADCGVVAIDRNDSNYNQVVDAITAEISALTAAHADRRAAISAAAMATAEAASWANFINDYEKAYSIAIKNNQNNR
jgi:glycosyltransferase involved in cell wall biosynthesis